MKAGVITFPGSNCDDDCAFSLSQIGAEVSRLWHKEATDLTSYDLIVLPGGFSYGDYLRCGAVAALSPIMTEVKKFAAGGGLVLGICNGFQILCEAGLLPGALAKNESLNFICRDVFLKVVTNESPWTSKFSLKDAIELPIAHGDGRYVADSETIGKLKNGKQILLTYCNADGKQNPEANPNGSLENIAGICNEKRNVFGLMPHPERASDLRSQHGAQLWESVAHWLQENKK